MMRPSHDRYTIMVPALANKACHQRRLWEVAYGSGWRIDTPLTLPIDIHDLGLNDLQSLCSGPQLLYASGN